MPDSIASNGSDNSNKLPSKPAAKANGNTGLVKLNGSANGSQELFEPSVGKKQENFVFEDQDHYNFLLDKLNTLRKSKQFCDVILQVINVLHH